jgi:cysteine desulfurase NifS
MAHKEAGPKERKAICGICPAGCWVAVTYDGQGRISAVRADPSSPLGGICRLGEHSAQIVYSDHRLLSPLKRAGPKGTFDFREITWDQAFDIITSRLRSIRAESGPESAAIYTGRGSFELAMCDVFQPAGVAVSSASSVLFPFGSPNTMGVGALCYVSYAMIAPHVTMGAMHLDMFSDIEQADLIVVWGANPATDSPPVDLQRILDARERGAKVVVIDPRYTRTASLSQARWIPIRPGTDGALALGLCHVLIAEELYDQAFVKSWTRGFDQFERYVKHFRPEVVQSITGVPADTVRWLAERISSARGAAPVMYTGLEYSDSGVQAIRATMVLWALAGQLDVPGGRCFSMPGSSFPVNRSGLIPNPDVKKSLGSDLFPVYTAYRGESHANALPRSVLDGIPYRIRSLIILGASIITSWPRPEVWRRALGALDFLACIDVNLTADCAYADLVLPASTWFEIQSYMRYGPVFRIRDKVIEPRGESRNAFFILAELADRLGYGHLYPRNEDELLRHALKGSPFTLEDVRAAGGSVQVETRMMEYRKWEKGLLRKDGKPGFDTPTGLFEIASSVLEEHGYDGLPVYTEPGEGPLASPSLAGRFPLVFNSGSRVTTDFRSQFHHIPGLVKDRPEPTVMMNKADALDRGIGDGDEVVVESPRGQVRMRAIVTDRMVRGAVDASMGGGGPLGPEAWQSCNINDLTDLRFDPISGFPIYKSLLCEVKNAGMGKEALHINTGEGMPETGAEGTDHKTAEARQAGEQGETTADRPYPTAARSHHSGSKLPAPGEGERIYLDHNATTPISVEVFLEMERAMHDLFGNASSIHLDGRSARVAIENARRKVAGLLGATARRIIFTGCGSEANNQVIKGTALSPGNVKRRLITSSIEHPSVMQACRWLEGLGFKVTYLPVDVFGRVDPCDLASEVDHDTFLVSIMTANNETGTLQPIAELASLAHEKGALFHTDAVQAVGKMAMDARSLDVDFMTMSAHKLGGPKGVGALYVKNDISLEPLIHGGSQEHGLRAGTENTVGIVGLGKAAELASRMLPDMASRVARMRDALEQGIQDRIRGAAVNGHPTDRLPNTLSISLPGIRGESMVIALDAKGISLSSGSACRSGSSRPSHALMAMGLTEEQAHCTLRCSLGIENTEDQMEKTLNAMKEVLRDSLHMVRFSACR